MHQKKWPDKKLVLCFSSCISFMKRYNPFTSHCSVSKVFLSVRPKSFLGSFSALAKTFACKVQVLWSHIPVLHRWNTPESILKIVQKLPEKSRGKVKGAERIYPWQLTLLLSAGRSWTQSSWKSVKKIIWFTQRKYLQNYTEFSAERQKEAKRSYISSQNAVFNNSRMQDFDNFL